MSLGLYVHRATPLHRLAPAPKVAVLLGAGIGAFMVDDPKWLLAALAAVIALYAVARVPLIDTARQLRPLALLMAIIFLVHGYFTSWTLGLVVVLRFAVLLSLALLVSFTTRVSEMIDSLERGLRPLTVIGVNPAKVSLALSLSLRFIPLLCEMTREIREAQRARGLERSVVALAVPLLVKTLRMAGDISDAIDARCYDSGPPSPRPDRRGSENGRS